MEKKCKRINCFKTFQATNFLRRLGSARTSTSAPSRATRPAASTPSARTRSGRTGASASQGSGFGTIPGPGLPSAQPASTSTSATPFLASASRGAPTFGAPIDVSANQVQATLYNLPRIHTCIDFCYLLTSLRSLLFQFM